MKSARSSASGLTWRLTLRQRIHLVVAILVLLLAWMVVSAFVAGTRAASANEDVTQRLLPALIEVESLRKAYRDQVIGVREYTLTGQPAALEPYTTARTAMEIEYARLIGRLADNPAAMTELVAIQDAYDVWLRDASEPVLAMVAAGRTEDAMAIIGTGGLSTRLFTVLRERVDALRDIVHGLLGTATGTVHAVQRDLRRAVMLTAVIGMSIVVLALVDLRRSVTRPIADLVTSVSAVAGGALDKPVRTGGPAEIVVIASAVEHMRQKLARHTQQAVATEHRLTKHRESERISTDLRDRVIGRLFNTGISLTSLAGRHREAAEPLLTAVHELDEVIGRLRRVIFDLDLVDRGHHTVRDQIMSLVDEVERDLGFAPTVDIDGPVDAVVSDDLADEVVATAREALSAISLHDNADHAAIRLSVSGSSLHLLAEHDGIRMNAVDHDERWAAIATRAIRLGGSCTVRQDEQGRTFLDWAVPTGV